MASIGETAFNLKKLEQCFQVPALCLKKSSFKKNSCFLSFREFTLYLSPGVVGAFCVKLRVIRRNLTQF